MLAIRVRSKFEREAWPATPDLVTANPSCVLISQLSKGMLMKHLQRAEVNQPETEITALDLISMKKDLCTSRE
jgi:hypothetical protein